MGKFSTAKDVCGGKLFYFGAVDPINTGCYNYYSVKKQRQQEVNTFLWTRRIVDHPACLTKKKNKMCMPRFAGASQCKYCGFAAKWGTVQQRKSSVLYCVFLILSDTSHYKKEELPWKNKTRKRFTAWRI